jgi:hypothetical protein
LVELKSCFILRNIFWCVFWGSNWLWWNFEVYFLFQKFLLIKANVQKLWMLQYKNFSPKLEIKVAWEFEALFGNVCTTMNQFLNVWLSNQRCLLSKIWQYSFKSFGWQYSQGAVILRLVAFCLMSRFFKEKTKRIFWKTIFDFFFHSWLFKGIQFNLLLEKKKNLIEITFCPET